MKQRNEHFQKRLGRLFLPLVAVMLMASPVFAASSVENYFDRLNRAKKAVDLLVQENSSGLQTNARLEPIKKLLPADEEIETGGGRIRADNRWLHEAIDQILQNAQTEAEHRRSMLVDLQLRLDTLNARVREGLAPVPGNDRDLRAKLDEIRARPEYRAQHEQESSIRGLARKLKKLIADLLNKIFGSRSPAPTQVNRGEGASFFRLIILLATIASLIFGLYRMSRFRFKRKEKEEAPEAREVLGEEIAADATSTDLLSAARELACKGEFRAAIRRTYIALLFEYEQRGKLNLHRSKTNRDYVNAMRSESGVYPAFSSMTGDYERVWYGQQRATEAEFHRFLDQYQETIKS